jgi:hypothetical protein
LLVATSNCAEMILEFSFTWSRMLYLSAMPLKYWWISGAGEKLGLSGCHLCRRRLGTYCELHSWFEAKVYW